MGENLYADTHLIYASVTLTFQEARDGSERADEAFKWTTSHKEMFVILHPQHMNLRTA